jgi:Zn finger protein HypA/HybF involved in hydrogenase expression
MGLLRTIAEAFEASTQSTNRGSETTQSTGAYWCHDCAERIPDFEVEGDSTPACPDCGDEMAFERSTGSTGCAC